MAKVIKLKDRQGGVVLPLTRSQLVQVSEITGLDLLNNKTFTSASVQDALEALYSYASTNNAGYDKDIQDIKNALKGVLDATGAVVNYVDAQDSAYLALAYAQSAADAAAAQANSYHAAGVEAAAAQARSYAEAASKATAAETAAKNYADSKFLANVKMNNNFLNVQSDANGRYVDLGNIATSEGLQTLTEKVNAIAAAYITKAASEEADQAIITAYKDADTALGNRIDEVITSYKAADAALGNRIDNVITSYQDADAAIISGYQAADSAIITSYQNADAALTSEINALKTSYGVSVSEANGSGDIAKVYTITQAGETIGTINIPKDMVATQGELVHGSLVENTFTPAEGGDPYIKMTVGNGNSSDVFYIPVAELIEYNSVDSTAEVTLSQDANHKITATIGTISSSKITFTPAGENPTDTTVQAALRDLYSQLGAGGSVASQIQTAIQALDADLDASGTAQHSGTFVMSGVTEVDGVITAVDSVEVEAAGAAAAVKSELLGGADISNNTLGKLAARIDTLNGAAVKSVNGQAPDSNGAVTVNASQIDTSYTFKIGSDASATTHKVDEVLAYAVFYEELSTSTTYDDVNLTL